MQLIIQDMEIMGLCLVRRGTVLEELWEEHMSLKNLEPQDDDLLQYRVWWLYYKYIHEERRAHHYIISGRLQDGGKLLLAALDILKEIEQHAGGNFPSLRLKVYRHTRDIGFMRESIKIIQAQKEMDPTGVEFQKEHRWSTKRRQADAFELIEWIDNLEREYLGSI